MASYCWAAGVNTLNIAPCGSIKTADPPNRWDVERLDGDLPARGARLRSGGVGVWHREINMPVIRHALHGRLHASPDFGIPHLEQVVRLPRTHLHGRGAHTEYGLVERQRRFRLVRDQFIPGHRPRFVGQRRADVLIGLPQPDHRARRIGHEGHRARIAHGHGRHQNLSARRADLLHRRVDVVHRDVRVPHRRHALGRARRHRRDRRDGFPIQQRHRIRAALRHRLVVIAPAQQRRVELLARGLVGGLQVDPARCALLVLGSLWHDRPFVSWRMFGQRPVAGR